MFPVMASPSPMHAHNHFVAHSIDGATLAVNKTAKSAKIAGRCVGRYSTGVKYGTATLITNNTLTEHEGVRREKQRN